MDTTSLFTAIQVYMQQLDTYYAYCVATKNRDDLKLLKKAYAKKLCQMCI